MRISNTTPKFISKPIKRELMRGVVRGWIHRHIRRDYLIACFLSAPLWVKRSDFNELARQKAREEKITGIKHVLDHIVPVTHPYVCGLTVPWNMRVIPAGPNAAKSNHWHPDQLHLPLPQVEQFRLFQFEER